MSAARDGRVAVAARAVAADHHFQFSWSADHEQTSQGVPCPVCIGTARRIVEALDAHPVMGTVAAAHWHMIENGIEFEDAQSRFVHITFEDNELYLALAGRMLDQGVRRAG